jgi:3',5'-cyclic AMP phosphodiesterase CpdA
MKKIKRLFFLLFSAGIPGDFFLLLLFLTVPLRIIAAQDRDDDNPFFFVQITDPQLGMFENNAGFSKEIDLYKSAVSQINKIEPDFVVITGDFVHNPKDEAQISEFKKITSQIDSGIPIYLVPGNHDIGQNPDSINISRYIDIYGYDKFSFIHKNTLFIGLNGCVIKENTAGFEQEQFEWLEEILQHNYQNVNHIILFNHFPFFIKSFNEPETYSNNRYEIREKYFALFSKFGVDAIFSGHLHNNSVGEYLGVTQVTTSAVGKQLGKASSGLRIIQVDANKFTHSYHGLNEVPSMVNYD